MISHQYKCIFIHIPKCAGTSIEAALGHFDKYQGRGKQDHRSIRMIEQPLPAPHLLFSKENYSELMRRLRYNFRSSENPNNKITVTKSQHKSYFKFTFVRNPWARAFSLYKNIMRDEIHKRKHRLNANCSLNEFLRLHVGKGMLRPQTYWIKDFKGAIPLDYIGRFENLREDFKTALKMMGAPEIILPHRGKGSGADYREHYDKESIDIVAKSYQSEIELFGYSFF